MLSIDRDSVIRILRTHWDELLPRGQLLRQTIQSDLPPLVPLLSPILEQNP